WIGIGASLAVILNLWPRAGLLASFVCFLSFIAAAQEFSSYQSDGMLLEAGFISLFFAPAGLRPRLGIAHPPSRLSLFLLRWEWFRIYFESGIVKIASGDYSWRHLTAMDDYYQNGPLPTWVGWYCQHLPHWFHAATAFMTLAAELGLVFMMFLPRRFKIICFFILTPFQIGIILTANYTFLNYLVLVLGFLLLDDEFLRRFFPKRLKETTESTEAEVPAAAAEPDREQPLPLRSRMAEWLKPVRRVVAGVSLLWVFYVTTALLLATVASLSRNIDVSRWERSALWKPVDALEPFRCANSYGLFAVMTHERYEIEFQGTQDGENWIAYPFRYKPQDLTKPPGIYAPYQPRFEWNLWFASLGPWRRNLWVVNAEARLLDNEPDVLKLFASNPFSKVPPRQVRTVLWQYWFTDRSTKRREGNWWRRQLIGLYAPALERMPDGRIGVAESGSGLLEVEPPER
ncbi:MAG TPA: lipase maturation factor family protein, partial [Candidatus Angelobacter sp.]|nr:lipase maturation factor family protein [Candidatus Angelobacter sp.]